ncbi:transcription factor 7-like 2 [Anneissia japonica]|uniref:transcription factor 7-like 2 n=1 Tax=Anneissia japonica TaxID=1529436 RepID=UPI0014257A9F|nr:transcription factor 7-like 2 [Anneissia japonica]
MFCPFFKGIPRSRHGGDIGHFYPLSPGPYSPLEYVQWQRQPFYPFSSTALRSPYSSPLSVSAASIPRLTPTGLPPSHPAMHLPGMPPHAAISLGVKHDLQQHSNDREREKEAPRPPEKKRPHVKKPLNAFMLYMKEMRAQVVKECTLKESAAINQILGRRWHALSREEQSKYYDLARKERQLHMQLYPGWSARDNYALVSKKKKRKKDKSQGDGSG